MTVYNNPFANQNTFQDYARLEEEFQARKQQQMMAQQLQQAQIAMQMKDSDINNRYKEAQLANIPLENKLKMMELGAKLNNETIVPEGSTPPANNIMSSLMNVESGGNPNALSPKGAAGLYQIMPDTARDPGFGVKPLQGWDGQDPRTAPQVEQQRFANDYLNSQIKRYGDTRLGLAAYNAGAGNVDKAKMAGNGDYGATMAALPQETQNYVPKVLAGAGQPTEQPRPKFLMKGGKPYTEGLKQGMQWAVDDKGNRYAAQIPGSSVGGEDGFKNENTLRDEFNTLTKDFRTAQDAYTKITSTSDTAAGDVALLYGTAKLNDPGSVVREADFALQASAGSYGDRIQNLYNQIATGNRLTKGQRENLIAEAKNTFSAMKKGNDRIIQNYKKFATNYKLNPDNIIADYSAPDDAPLSSNMDIGKVADVEFKLRKNNFTPEQIAEYKKLKGL